MWQLCLRKLTARALSLLMYCSAWNLACSGIYHGKKGYWFHSCHPPVCLSSASACAKITVFVSKCCYAGFWSWVLLFHFEFLETLFKKSLVLWFKFDVRFVSERERHCKLYISWSLHFMKNVLLDLRVVDINLRFY